jgi:hypothetical protein
MQKSMDRLSNPKGTATGTDTGSQQTLAASLKELLGDDGYEKYTDYATTAAARIQLDQITAEFAREPLNSDQSDKLLQVMKQAQSDVGYGSNSSPAADAADPAAAMQSQLQRQETVNQQILAQSANFLTPTQLQMLGTSQSNLMSFMKMGAAMAQKMYGQSN